MLTHMLPIFKDKGSINRRAKTSSYSVVIDSSEQQNIPQWHQTAAFPPLCGKEKPRPLRGKAHCSLSRHRPIGQSTSTAARFVAVKEYCIQAHSPRENCLWPGNAL